LQTFSEKHNVYFLHYFTQAGINNCLLLLLYTYIYYTFGLNIEFCQAKSDALPKTNLKKKKSKILTSMGPAEKKRNPFQNNQQPLISSGSNGMNFCLKNTMKKIHQFTYNQCQLLLLHNK
jgi:hypothetical protein